MASIVAIVRHETDPAIENMKYIISYPSNELIVTADPYTDGSESLQSSSESGTE